MVAGIDHLSMNGIHSSARTKREQRRPIEIRDRALVTGGLARNTQHLMQIMADVMERSIEVPEIDNTAAVGAGISRFWAAS